MTGIYQDYFRRGTAEVARFVDSLKENAAKEGGVFDSAAATDFLATAANQSAGVKVPDTFQAVLDEANGDENVAIITRAVLDGAAAYEAQHGVPAPADVIEQAMHAAYATTDAARRQYHLDSADSNHHDQISLQPNRAVIAILSAMTEAIPFAHYLPADIGSNEARLAIMTHHAGKSIGSYVKGWLMDGVASGDIYISSGRVNTSYPSPGGSSKPPAGQVSGKIGSLQDTSNLGDEKNEFVSDEQIGGPLLRGRSIVYVDGRVAARENNDTSGSGNSPIAGSINVGGTTYSISGTINTDTGEYTLSTSPALPATVPVVVEGFIDFERDPDKAPAIISAVNTFSLFAVPWRVTTHQTIDARTQMANELGLDPYSESIIAIQAQFANERHYDALRKGRRLAALNTVEFDFGAAQAHVDSGRFGVWPELAYHISIISQKMAEDTINHGVTHLYVTKRVAAQFMGLPGHLFQSSGIAPRPGIYRLGRIFGQYDVYYTPKGLNETVDSAQILAVGRATDVTRNPIVLGDAVPPTVIPLAINADLRQGAGFYARNFTAVNPHDPSSRGFGLITVTNM
jgi:hypothetical protein